MNCSPINTQIRSVKNTMHLSRRSVTNCAVRKENNMELINAYLFTADAENMECGYLRVENGKITGIGDMKDYQADGSEVIDLTGKRIYPGFIDAHCHIGMWPLIVTLSSPTSLNPRAPSEDPEPRLIVPLPRPASIISKNI